MQKSRLFFIYLIAPILSLSIFAAVFQVWNLNLYQPIFVKNSDVFFTTFVAKTIISQGWFFFNNSVGFPQIDGAFSFHDFPIHADFLNLFIIKILALFSQNPFLVVNSFFIITFALISLSSFAVLRHSKISIFSATLVSILYSFTHYHLVRGTSHLFLSNYAIVPLIIMVFLWIIENKIKILDKDKNGRVQFIFNNFAYLSLLIAAIAATSGIYYAFYSCIIFIFALFIRGLKNGKFRNLAALEVLTLCFVIFLILVFLHFPVISYWAKNGYNASVVHRGLAESEFYALKIIYLFLPSPNHYFDYFSNLRGLFDSFSKEMESGAASLGILASAGFLFLSLWLIAKNFDDKSSFLQKTIKKFNLDLGDQNLISKLAILNFLLVLFATAGGLVMFVSAAFPMLRSHARFSIFIAFISLFLVAIIFDKIIEKKIFGQKKYAQIFILIIFVIALFDQVGKSSLKIIQPQELKNELQIQEDFIKKIEGSTSSQLPIFILPISYFPEGGDYGLTLPYLYSKNLKWSYPAMVGRKGSRWQSGISNLDYKNLVNEVKKAGFGGIYIDRIRYTKNESWANLRKLETTLKGLSKKAPLVSNDLKLVFFEI